MWFLISTSTGETMFPWSQHFRNFPNGSISGIQENKCSGVVTVNRFNKTWGVDIIQMVMIYISQHYVHHVLTSPTSRKHQPIHPSVQLTHPKWRKWVLRPSDLYPQRGGSPNEGFRDSTGIPIAFHAQLAKTSGILRFPLKIFGEFPKPKS